MTKIRDAVCPGCKKVVSVTYWPFNVPLYSQHSMPGTERDCEFGLRPVKTSQPEVRGLNRKSPPANSGHWPEQT
jgi:hypothetical protein